MGPLGEIYAGATGGQESFDPTNSRSQAINPSALFNGSTLFSQIIVAPLGRTVWISGLIGVGVDNLIVPGGKAAQLRQVFVNIAAAFQATACLPSYCTRLTEYIVDYTEADIKPLQQAINVLFTECSLPTNVIVPVSRLGRDNALIEIELCCVIPDARLENQTLL